MYLYVHCYIILGGQDMEIIKVFLDRWLNIEKVVLVYNIILLSHNKKWNAVICDNMDGSWEYHAKWNKSESDRTSQKTLWFHI